MAYLIWSLNIQDFLSEDFIVETDRCHVYVISADGIYFQDGPRLINDPPYNGSVVIPPGGRADLLINCLKSGTYSAIAGDINSTQNTTFKNAPLPGQKVEIMRLYVTGDDFVNETGEINNCSDWRSDAIPCEFVPYHYSPYLSETRSETYPTVTSNCVTERPEEDDMTQCNIVFQRVFPWVWNSNSNLSNITQLSVNHIKFDPDLPLLNISVGNVHEWLITSNFHQFHQHIWPYQMQSNVIDGWLAKDGDFRDTVGAPGSFVVRSNLVGGFDKGKLIHHCHSVPHEDHGYVF